MTEKTRTSWKATLLALLAACGVGAYAWKLRTVHGATAKALTESQGRNAQLESEHEQLVACTTAREAAVAQCAGVEKLIAEMKGNLSTSAAELESLRKQRKESAARLAAFQDLTDRFRKMIDSGKLEVAVRDGRIVVQLPASVLFDSGRAELSREGELALMEVAVILRHFSDRRFMIEGHTDNRPLENSAEVSRYRNNWELSAARAITVVEFLIEARMKPENLLAAGHGEFDPAGDNSTPKGRQENRRIEIVLMPNVEELPPMDDARTEK